MHKTAKNLIQQKIKNRYHSVIYFILQYYWRNNSKKSSSDLYWESCNRRISVEPAFYSICEPVKKNAELKHIDTNVYFVCLFSEE